MAVGIMGLNMETKDLDIVYVLKNGGTKDEFRYSLRSLVNFPHRNVWVYGDCPEWATGVFTVPVKQFGIKWQNTSEMLKQAALNRHLSENFVYFNDDFFIMRPSDTLDYYYAKTLSDRIDSCKIKTGGVIVPSRYGQQLQMCDNYLAKNKLSTRNYELHIPMIFNRQKLAQAIRKLPDKGFGARRSLYGNLYDVGGVEREDCKIYGLLDNFPGGKERFVSTTDLTFARGLVGRQIRAKFKDKCMYEK